MIRTLSSQLELNQTDLKLNWIDKMVTNHSTKQPNSDYMNRLYRTNDDESTSYNYVGDYQQVLTSGELEPEFATDSQERLPDSGEEHNKDQVLLVSFSSSRLYDLQRLFLDNLKQLSGIIWAATEPII